LSCLIGCYWNYLTLRDSCSGAHRDGSTYVRDHARAAARRAGSSREPFI